MEVTSSITRSQDILTGNTYEEPRKAESVDLGKALAAQVHRLANYNYPEYELGPWEDLADWYWGYWNEIGKDLSRSALDDQIPSQPLRNELVYLYFQNVHPLCPIFDEVEFNSCYNAEGNDMSFLRYISLLEFQAMMFAASQHLTTRQIQNTNFVSTYQCHKSLFEIAKTTYHSCSHALPIALTRTAILLTYWSPYTSEQQTNHYWMDQAFANARMALLYEHPQNSTASVAPGRKKIIWWCCLLRDQLLAFGLRRFHRLHLRSLSCPLPSIEDFKPMSNYPMRFHRPQTLPYAENFIAQCALSQIMARILEFKETKPCPANAPKSGVSHPGTDRSKFASLRLELNNWKLRFEKMLEQVSVKMSHQRNMPYQMTKIHYNSAVATLHLPYVTLNLRESDIFERRFSENSLREVQEAASQIVKSIEMLAFDADSNDLPCSMGAWIVLPIAVKTVMLYNSADVENPVMELQQMRSLMNLLYLIKRRFSGGQFICNVMDTVMALIYASSDQDGQHEIGKLLQQSAGIIDRSLAHGIIPTETF